MRVVHPDVAFRDQRGAITDLVPTPVDSVVMITSVSGSVRGDHYHRESVEHVYVLEGRLLAECRHVGNGRIESVEIRTGDLLINEPNEVHRIVALRDSVIISMTRGPKQNGDTFPEAVRP